jgi:hypothetical protein
MIEEIENWINKIKDAHPNLNGNSICPFARTNTYKIIKCSINNIKPLNEKFGVVIFVIEDDITEKYIFKKIEEFNKKYPKYIFFEDLKNRPTFINGIQTNNEKYNLILYQNAKFLTKMRHILAKTDYYDFWSVSYLKKILNKGYNDIQKIRNNKN